MKKIKLFIFIICLFCVMFVSGTKVRAFTPLDRIEEYEIYIKVNDDATLDMHYIIKWRVLDSSDEAVNEIYVGVANRFVENIKVHSDQIKKAKLTTGSESRILCTLDRYYYEGELINLDFSFTQKRIFSKQGDEVTYAFVPGWFNETPVQSMHIYWEKEGATYNNAKSSNDKYYIWEASETFYGKIADSANVKYELSYFPNINLKEDYSDSTSTFWDTFGPLIIIILIVVIVIVLIKFVQAYYNDGYADYRGYTGRGYYYWYYRPIFHTRRGVDRRGNTIPPVVNNTRIGGGSSGGHSGGGCACACAGGGRAGCSRKDFYSAKIKDIKKGCE